MTIAVAANGATANGTSSATPAYLDDANAGDLLLCMLASGNDAPDQQCTVDNSYALVSGAHAAGGSGSYGTDTGNRMASIFNRIADATEDTSETITVTNGGGTASTRTTFCHILRLTKSATDWALQGSAGTDTSAGTAFSATSAASISMQPGDVIVIVAAWVPDNSTQSGVSVTASGITFGTIDAHRTTNTTSGADVRLMTFTVPVSSGTATTTITFAATASASVVGGAVAFVRIREFNQGTLATVSGTDQAQAFTGAKTGSYVLASETNQAQAFTGLKVGSLALASWTDQGRAFTGVKSGQLGVAVETNEALDLLVPTAGGFERAQETNQAIAFTGAKSGTLGVAIDTPQAMAFAGVKSGTLQIATVQDVAQIFFEAGTVAILPATLTDGTIGDVERNFYLVNLSLSEPNVETQFLERMFYLNQLSLSGSFLSTQELEREFYFNYLSFPSDPGITTARLARMFFLARLGLAGSSESNADLEYKAYYETN